MRQLALDLKLADYARFDTFYAGPNSIALEALRTAASAVGPGVDWLWGMPGSGRSHLLQAAVAQAAAAGRAATWIPMDRHAEMHPDMLEGIGTLQLVCIDDVDAVAGRSDWEQALFNLCEAARCNNARLVLSATMPPAQAGIALRDLESRLASGPVWKLVSLSDAELVKALQLRAHWRGLELPDDTMRYLMRRVPRSSEVLFELLDRLDAAALESQRRLTIPFVKEVFELPG
jgi:DnaA family protein